VKRTPPRSRQSEPTKYQVGALRPVTSGEIAAVLRLIARHAADGDAAQIREVLDLPHPDGGAG
jgi:hypothetical protein